jgi:hypothetical protein
MKLVDRLYLPDRFAEGVGKIELFDAHSGRKQNEVPFHNFIAIPQLEYIKQQARFGFSGPGPDCASYPGVNTAEMARPDCMAYIVCSKYNAAEVPASERYPFGDIVGWSDRTAYVGADTKRGSVNISETIKTRSYSRWVFDWPTNAANDTFRSVLWAGSISAGSNQYGSTASYSWGLTESSIDGGIGAGAFLFNYVTNSYWTRDIGLTPLSAGQALADVDVYACVGVKNTVDKFDWGNGTIVSSLSAATLGVGASTIGGVTYDPNGGTPALWVTGWTTTSIYKRNASTGAAISSFVGPAGEAGFGPIDFDGTYLWVIGITTGKVYQLTTAGAVVTSWTPGATMTGIAVDSNGDVWLSETPVGTSPTYWVYTGTGTYKGKFAGYSGGTATYPKPIAWVRQDGTSRHLATCYSVSTSTSDGILLHDWQMLGARVNLAADVTKTSLQTMKITYEFQFS